MKPEQLAQCIQRIKSFDGLHQLVLDYAEKHGYIKDDEDVAKLRKEIDDLNCEIYQLEEYVAELEDEVDYMKEDLKYLEDEHYENEHYKKLIKEAQKEECTKT